MPRTRQETKAEIQERHMAQMQEQLAQLTQAMQALVAQRKTDPAIAHEEDDLADDVTDANPFAVLGGNRARAQQPHPNNDYRWEHGFKSEIPEYNGGPTAEELLDWLVTVEEILEFKKVPLDQCVPVIAMRFRQRAAAWWTQIKSTRTRQNKPKIATWDKLKKHLRKTFLPYNYDQLMFQRLHHLRQGTRTVEEYSTEFFLLLNRIDLQDSDSQLVARYIGGLRQKIQHTLNLFNPLTLAEAHQQAITVEAQNKTNFSPWSSNRAQRTSPIATTPATTTTATTTPVAQETTIIPINQNQQRRPGTLRCFACGEPGHRQADCPTRNRRGLLLDSTGRDVEIEVDDDFEEATEELEADTGV